LNAALKPVNKARQRAKETSNFLDMGQFSGSRRSSVGFGINKILVSLAMVLTVIVAFSSGRMVGSGESGESGMLIKDGTIFWCTLGDV
jgi:hypothetical protein